MFSKLISTSALVLALSATQAYAHCAIAPQLGIQGTPVRNDVQRPSSSAECGSTDIASNIDTSTAVPLSSTNSFQVTAINFNGGQDGSTQVTALVDPTGTGKSFTSATVTKNGVLAPPAAGSAQIDVSLPSGTKCTGGKAKNLCLVSFTTAGGFGNCVVVSQGASTGAASSSASSSAKEVAATTEEKQAASTSAVSKAASTAAATEAKANTAKAASSTAASSKGDKKATGKKGDKKEKGKKGDKKTAHKHKKGGKKDAKKDAKKDSKKADKKAGADKSKTKAASKASATGKSRL